MFLSATVPKNVAHKGSLLFAYLPMFFVDAMLSYVGSKAFILFNFLENYFIATVVHHILVFRHSFISKDAVVALGNA